MASALLYDRLQFAFTATFHYLFSQLTMGLALVLMNLHTRVLTTVDDHYQEVAEFVDDGFLPSVSASVSSPKSRSNFNLGSTGQELRTMPAESSAKPWPWKESLPFSGNRRSLACCFSGIVSAVERYGLSL